MTAKFDNFRAALEALCREHECQIASSTYDEIEVFDLRNEDEPVYGGIIDKTSQDIG